MKQTYLEYLRARVRFQVAVGLWQEFDTEANFVLEEPNEEGPVKKERGDFAIPCMGLAPVIRKSPNEIARTLMMYLLDAPGLQKIEVVNGYINIYLDKFEFYANVVGDANG